MGNIFAVIKLLNTIVGGLKSFLAWISRKKHDKAIETINQQVTKAKDGDLDAAKKLEDQANSHT